MEINVTREARCGCGNLKVVVVGDPVRSYACHCDYCQKASGSIAAFGAVYREEDFLSFVGAETIFDDIPKWPGAKKHFCSKCGTTVHWVNPVAFPGMRMVSIGCFADPHFPGPAAQVQTQYRHAWCGDFRGADVCKEFA
tara:strand:- start:190 stop:606 length:417 start_codon:yes stop_codon:yes gene_type:complete